MVKIRGLQISNLSRSKNCVKIKIRRGELVKNKVGKNPMLEVMVTVVG